MASLLLATKLGIPPASQHAVKRPRLVERLERDIPHYKLVLLSAPAGYGKTTLLAQWARSSRFPVAWLSLSDEDNDIERFFRYLVTAWEAVLPSVRDSSLGLLLDSKAPDLDSVLAWFINVANSDLPDHLAFVLDDFHLIDEPSIDSALAFLVDHLPAKVHFVFAGRGAPRLPLARYRARQELLELRSDDLHFRLDETTDFLNRQMGLDLGPAEIESLQARLEGWIAGIQLAALTLPRRDRGDAFDLRGTHRYIADYLSEDVLARRPRHVQRFLLQTSILDRLNGSLCDAVTGKNDGARMLEQLERENLFLVPLDDRREWYRYHRLFADFLRAELGRRHPEGIHLLHGRAARWFHEHAEAELAFRHAVDGRDIELVVDVAEDYLFSKIVGGELRDVQRWLSWIPTEWDLLYPEVGIYRAALALATGSFDDCTRRLNQIEQQLANDETGKRQRRAASVPALRCFMACYQNDLSSAEIYADEALQALPLDDFNFRPGIYGALGDTYRRNGYWKEAEQWYLKLLDYGHAQAFRVEAAHLFGALADLDLRRGRLRSAAGYWRKAQAAIEEPDNRGTYSLPVIGWVYVRMADLLYEWNELAEAAHYLVRGLERAELAGDVRTLIAGHLVAGRLKLTEGDMAAATESLERVRPLLESAPFPDWASRFERLQLELWLAQGRLPMAAHWADERPPAATLSGQEEAELLRLAMARVQIIKGDDQSLGQALTLLHSLAQTAEAEGRMGIQIEALALQALAHWRRGDRPSALMSLERALRLAESEDYTRLFADLGASMARLLQHARSRAVMPEYVGRVLAAFGAVDVPGQATPAEPLTRREQEILALLAAGLTNKEIADRLVISSQTVKKHTGNIYGKLGAHSRTEAVALARDLDLLT